MTTQKIVKKIGNSYVLILSREEREIFNLHKGDIIRLTIEKVIPNQPESSPSTISQENSNDN